MFLNFEERQVHTRSGLAYETTLRRKAFRCSMAQGDLTASTSFSAGIYSLLIPFAPKGYGWLDGVYFTCRLYFDTMGVRSPSKPNLRSISRANTLRERDGRIARERDSSPFSSLLLTSVVILLWHGLPATLLYIRHKHTRKVYRERWVCSLNWLEFPAGRDLADTKVYHLYFQRSDQSDILIVCSIVEFWFYTKR